MQPLAAVPQPGRFEATTVAAIDGVYRVRVVATGVTFSGSPFAREQNLTGTAFHGGDQAPPTTLPRQHSPLCCIIESLTEDEAVRRYLGQHGIDPKASGRRSAGAARHRGIAPPRHPRWRLSPGMN